MSFKGGKIELLEIKRINGNTYTAFLGDEIVGECSFSTGDDVVAVEKLLIKDKSDNALLDALCRAAFLLGGEGCKYCLVLNGAAKGYEGLLAVLNIPVGLKFLKNDLNKSCG